jgi:hypothetical protein
MFLHYLWARVSRVACPVPETQQLLWRWRRGIVLSTAAHVRGKPGAPDLRSSV